MTNEAIIVDKIVFYAMIVAPPIITLRWRWRGFLYGVVLVWFLGIAAGQIIQYFDPNRDMALLDSIWEGIGWVAGVIWCAHSWAFGSAGIGEKHRRAIP